KTGVIKADGTVTRPSYTAGDATVTLTASIKKGSVEETKTFTLTVTKLAQTDAEAVAAAKAAVEVGYASGESASDVKQNLTLSTNGTDGTSV
ncbi:immunoglobulin-like domain-containing protein, partial [Paenibacillus sp. CCS19]|uniref:immunoglobulin-like domain-containing protein n=1 Tax=Paenibacillus sp. CCS19 TaxID=3158387 RepID=UPI00295F4F68